MNEKASIAVWCGTECEICDDLPIKWNDDRTKFEVIDPDSNKVIDSYISFEIDRIEPSEVAEIGYYHHVISLTKHGEELRRYCASEILKVLEEKRKLIEKTIVTLRELQ